jgi:uncharacterized membrane protein required for colicin V production
MSLAWPDLVIVVIAFIFALKGWKRGFVSELGGAVAFFIAIVAAFWYNGSLDDLAQTATHLGPGSSHVVGMIAFSLFLYLAVVAASFALSRFAKLPVVGTVNAAGGVLVGIAKALVGAWAVLYVVLFFPLAPDLRADLRRSPLVAIVTAPDAQVDPMLRDAMPWFVRPFTGPLFSRHRV